MLCLVTSILRSIMASFITRHPNWLHLIFVACLSGGFLRSVATQPSSNPQFVIGNLLPDARSLMLIGNMNSSRALADKQTCPSKLASVLYAIDFASTKLSEMFLQLYRCDFNLNPANTNVGII